MQCLTVKIPVPGVMIGTLLEQPLTWVLLGVAAGAAIWLLWGVLHKPEKREGLEKLVWPQSIVPLRDSLNLLGVELDRARRYGHSFAIVVLGLDKESAAGTNGHNASSADCERDNRLLISAASNVLRDNLRGSDIITFDASRNIFVILLAETTTAVAEQALTRMGKLIFDRTKTKTRFGIAEFPTDGLIIQDFINRAHARFTRTAYDLPKQDAAKTGQGAQRKESLTQ